MEDGLDSMIASLHDLKGPSFWKQLATITKRREFEPFEEGIITAIGPENPDFEPLLDAARKAVAIGYTVYILPNPRGTKSADFIFRRKGVYKLFELKTIRGKNSVGNRLKDACLQSNRVLLNMTIRYNPRLLAFEIARFFENNTEIREVLIFRKGKIIQIRRPSVSQNMWVTILKMLK